jgi:hypothetical protein
VGGYHYERAEPPCGVIASGELGTQTVEVCVGVKMSTTTVAGGGGMDSDEKVVVGSIAGAGWYSTCWNCGVGGSRARKNVCG